MKIWVPKQREVTVTIRDDNEPATHHLEPGELEVKDQDGHTRVYSNAEFEARFEQIEKNSWPGYLKRKSREAFMNGTLMVGFEGASLPDLIAAMNRWAEDPLNRHLILGDEGDKIFQGTDGRFYAVYYCYASTNPESIAHLDEVKAIEDKVKAEWEERKKQLKIDERNHLEKAQDAAKAQKVLDGLRQKALLDAERVAKHCQANHGKKMKGGKA